MRIFISWSGERSKEIAENLKEFIETVIGSPIEPFISSSDINAGEQWALRLTDELENTHFGIICLTPENLKSLWIQFEAGALSKVVNRSYVCPYLVNLEIKDIEYPLRQFQSVEADEKGTKKLIDTIFLASSPAITSCKPQTIEKRFNKFWPEYGNKLKDISGKGIIHDIREENWNRKMSELNNAIDRARALSDIYLGKFNHSIITYYDLLDIESKVEENGEIWVLTSALELENGELRDIIRSNFKNNIKYIYIIPREDLALRNTMTNMAIKWQLDCDLSKKDANRLIKCFLVPQHLVYMTVIIYNAQNRSEEKPPTILVKFPTSSTYNKIKYPFIYKVDTEPKEAWETFIKAIMDLIMYPKCQLVEELVFDFQD